MSKTERFILGYKNDENDTEEIIKSIKAQKAEDLKAAVTELEIAKLKAEIKKVEAEGQPIPQQSAQGLVRNTLAMTLSDPAKANALLNGLDAEGINKLALLMAIDDQRSNALLTLAQNKGTSTSELINLIKVMQPANRGTDSKGIIEAVKLGLEVSKANNPPTSNIKEQFETVMSFVNPLRADLEKTRQDLLDEKLENIKAQQVNPREWYKQQKEIAADMGLTTKEGGTSALDLKILEMQQSHDLDVERISWEQKKFFLQQDADREKWGAIQETFAPIFQMASPQIRDSIKDLGASLGKSLAPAGPETTQNPTGEVQNLGFICPGCKAQLNVDIPPNAPPEIPIKCPNCGVVTPAKIQEAPQETTPQTPAPKEEPPPRRSDRLGAHYR